MFADMRVTFKRKFRSTCHIYTCNFNRHEMIGVPTHEATNSKECSTIYVTCKKSSYVGYKWKYDSSPLKKMAPPKKTNNQQTKTYTWCSQPSTTYKETHHVRSPSHTRPGLKIRKNIPTRGPIGGLGCSACLFSAQMKACLALPPSSSESMKSNMFEALKRANVSTVLVVDTFSLLVSFFTWGSGFRWYFKISTQTTWEFADDMWIWTLHMNFSCSFHFSNSLLLLCNSSLKFTAPLFWKFHQQNSERNMFYHFLSTQLVRMSNFNHVFSLRKTIEVYSFLFRQHFRWGWKSPTGNPDCNASKTCRSNGGVEW